MINPREQALKILGRVEYGGAYSNLALKDGLEDLQPVDKRFVTNLVYGCISMKITLDHIIAQFSKTKIQKLSPDIHLILRMGTYQIFYMDKVPDSAAVNESVKLAEKVSGKSKGFVNAVLRNEVRNKNNIAFPTEKTDYLRTKYSFPKKLVTMLIEDVGEERAESIIKAFSETPKTYIRINRLKTDKNTLIKLLSEKGVKVEESELSDDALIACNLDINNSEEYEKGLFTVQDIAAQLACKVLVPKSGETVIDMCSAPGGKTTYLAELMENKGSITAFDIYPHKIELIEKSAERLGIDIITACVSDGSIYRKTLENKADKVLADVPCSGLGILRRKPEIKWKREDMQNLHQIQKSILINAVKYCKSGGEIVYSTCSIDKDENEKITEEVIKELDCIERIDITELLPKQLIKETTGRGYVTLYPDTDGTDGFFICKLRKK